MSNSSHKKVRDALADRRLQTALKRAAAAYITARKAAMEGFDFSESRKEVRAIKERSIAELDSLVARFKKEASNVGVVVHEARGAEDAVAIVRKLAEERGVRRIVKSKSMLTEEIELNTRLRNTDLDIAETDLGEWIIQLAGEKPSHFTMPAMHKTREQVAELFAKAIGEDVESDIPTLVEIARQQLRRKFIEADMGISGANVAIAETGGIVIVANEGNDRLVTTLPPIHVAIVGYEKIVSSIDDATEIIKVLSKSGTGQKQTAYVSFITGPSRTTDIEKTLAIGVHGPKEMHIILVDNGRKQMLAENSFMEALYCIKCGACLNMCPVYNSIGGHAYGNVYMGGIGAILTAFHKNIEATEETLGLCTGCGYCTTVCPSQIDTPRMMLELRKRFVEKQGLPLPEKLPLKVLERPQLFQGLLQTARRLQKPVVDNSGVMVDIPFVPGADSRRYPGLASKFLRELLPEQSSEAGKMTVSLFAGCMLDFVYPEIGEAIWDVLRKHDIRAIFSKDQCCCGAPAIYSGDVDVARKLAIDNILALEQGSPNYIITGCPTCAVVIKEKFPELFRETAWARRVDKVAAKVMDFAQFASDILKIKSTEKCSTKVTYHDPCHQVRSLGTSDCSRNLVRCSGCELVEMDDSDQCCGFAGSYAIKQSDISGAILRRKIENIEATGADIVATDCPGCIMQIRGGLLKRNSRIRVCHTAQLIAGTEK